MAFFMHNITVNMDNLSTDERNTLLKLIEKANKPKNRVWKPDWGERYYMISDNGTIVNLLCTRDNTDKRTFIIGNCFKTIEEAEFALEKQKVITELKRFALENNGCKLDWNDDTTSKCYLCYNHRESKIDVSFNSFLQAAVIYFSSEDIAKQAIKTIGKDRLKKYYFEVNDNE